MTSDTMGNTWKRGIRVKHLDKENPRHHQQETTMKWTDVYLVGQGYHDSVGDVCPLFNACVDDISDEQVEVEEGEEAHGHAQRQPPLRKEPQGEVLQLSGRRQGASVQDGEAELGGHRRYRLLRFCTVATQVHLQHGGQSFDNESQTSLLCMFGSLGSLPVQQQGCRCGFNSLEV